MRSILKNKIFYLFILLVFVNCKKELPQNEEDLVEFVKNKDNGYSQTKVINGITINLTYRPTELMVYQETSTIKNISKSKSDSIKKKYENNLYFILSYSKDNKEILSTVPTSREHFNSIQNNLTFGMNQFICLTNKKDTIPLIDFNFPRTYGMSRATNLLFVFNRNKIKNNGGELSFNLQDIGIGIGDITFNYPINLILEQSSK